MTTISTLKMDQRRFAVERVSYNEKTKLFDNILAQQLVLHACHVHLLDTYIGKLPDLAKAKDHFYFTPLSKVPSNPMDPWFSTIPIGWNKLDRYVCDMFEEVGIEKKSNHSLRVTGATKLYIGVEYRRKQSSIEALRVYERPGETQHREACNALANVINSPSSNVTNSQRNVPSQCTPYFNFSNCSVTIYNGPVMAASRMEKSQINKHLWT